MGSCLAGGRMLGKQVLSGKQMVDRQLFDGKHNAK